MFRHSLVGAGLPSPVDSPRKGHKRQNCVRIKNLTPVDPKKRLSSQLDRLAEAEEDSASNSILLPSPAKLRDRKRPMPAESSSSLNLPKVRPGALSLRVKRPGLMTSRTASSQSSQQEPQSATTLPSAGPSSVTSCQNRNRSKSPRARTTSGKQSTSPITKRKVPELDLRRSIAMLQTMTASPNSFDLNHMPKATSTKSSPMSNLSRQHSMRSPLAGDVSPLSTTVKQRSRSKTFAGHERTVSGTRSKRSSRNFELHDGEDEEPLLATAAPKIGPLEITKTRPVAKFNFQGPKSYKQTPPKEAKPSPSTISIWEDESVNGDHDHNLDSQDEVTTPELLTMKKYQSPPKMTMPISLQRYPSERRPVIIPCLTLLHAEQTSTMTIPPSKY
ncbi:hypothetical protein LTR66_017645, partial [Elasticomyces elasticus]